MAYGIDTGGGIGGGIARGLQEGASLYQGIVGGAQERQLRQKQEDRLDQQTQMAIHQARAETLRTMADDANDQLASLAQGGAPDEQLTAALQRKQQINSQLQDAMIRIAGPQVLDGLNQAAQDGRDLRAGRTTFEQMGPDRTYNAHAIIYPEPIKLVDHQHYEHDDGTTTVGQNLDAFHQHMGDENYQGAHEASGNLVSHLTSMHDPDHEAHYPGLAAHHDPSVENDHIPAVATAIGQLGTYHAALNNDTSESKQTRDLLIQAHKDGGQDRVNFARQLLYLSGGPRGLAKTLATESDEEKKYKFVYDRLKQAHPDWSDERLGDETLNRTVRDPMSLEMEKFKNEQIIEGQRTDSAEKIEGMRSASERDVANIRNKGRGVGLTIDAIQEQVDSGAITEEAGSQMIQHALQSNAGRYDKLPRSTGEETIAQMQRRATEQAKADLARDPTLGKSVNELAGRYYKQAKADQDRARAAASASPGGGTAAPVGGGGDTPQGPLPGYINPVTGKPFGVQ